VALTNSSGVQTKVKRCRSAATRRQVGFPTR
jgi:hypothetical protein